MNEESKTGIIRDEQGRFVDGISGNPNGRPPDTPEEKVVKKATKEFINDYKEKLAEALPKISPVLIAKAIAGDIGAIKEVHDRVMGKAPIDINLGNQDDLPFTIIFKGESLKKDNGSGTNS